MNDLDIAIQCQAVYDGKIPTVTTAGIDYAIIEGCLIFEGTHDIEDKLRDLEALMVDTGWGRVHGGAWEGIPQVIDAIWDNFSEDKPILLCGHSLGAMRACLAACELYRRGFRNIEVVTFGCPLWGDAVAVNYFKIIQSRSYQNYLNLLQHDFFTMIPVHLELEPYVPPPNRICFWSAPTAANEYKLYGEMIEAHSLADCYIPGVRKELGL